MKILLSFLTIVLFNFGANADKKTDYFVKNCLTHIFKNEDQSKNIIIKESLRHFGLVDLNEKRKQSEIRGFGKHYCYTDDLKFERNKLECASSYGICLFYDVKKPWGEIYKKQSKCYMNRDGEVLYRTAPLNIKYKPSVDCDLWG